MLRVFGGLNPTDIEGLGIQKDFERGEKFKVFLDSEIGNIIQKKRENA